MFCPCQIERRSYILDAIFSLYLLIKLRGNNC